MFSVATLLATRDSIEKDGAVAMNVVEHLPRIWEATRYVGSPLRQKWLTQRRLMQ